MLLPTGLLFPDAVLQSPVITVLAGFVAVNTVIYATLAIAKLIPMVHLSDILPRRLRRSETRSIFLQVGGADGAGEPLTTNVASIPMQPSPPDRTDSGVGNPDRTGAASAKDTSDVDGLPGSPSRI